MFTLYDDKTSYKTSCRWRTSLCKHVLIAIVMKKVPPALCAHFDTVTYGPYAPKNIARRDCLCVDFITWKTFPHYWLFVRGIHHKGPIMHSHDNVIKWKHFPRYWPFVRGIHRSPVNSPNNGQWRGALMLSLICAWMNGWVNTRETGDLRRHRAHYDVIIMFFVVQHTVDLAPWRPCDVIVMLTNSGWLKTSKSMENMHVEKERQNWYT